MPYQRKVRKLKTNYTPVPTQSPITGKNRFKIRMCRPLAFMLCLALSKYSFAALVEYELSFTQTYFHPNFGNRFVAATFYIDDSLIGAGNENKSYSPSPSVLVDFTSSIFGNENYVFEGNGNYIFDVASTLAADSPAISFIVQTDEQGVIFRVSGRLSYLGTLSEIILGRDGEESQYYDVQQVSEHMAPVVSYGTYTISPSISLVPVPAAMWLFGSSVFGLLWLKHVRKVQY